jgi:hypothetical protein
VKTVVTQLPAALNQGVSLTVDSSLPVCKGVQASASYAKALAASSTPAAPPPPKAVQPIAPAPTVFVRPIDVLQTLGLAMLPPRHVTQHLASWHWTLMRYAYLIELAAPNFAPLATNNLAGDYRYHHMTALSEAFGVGCALSYAREWLRVVAPGATVHDPIDFDYLLGPVATSLPGAASSILAQRAANARRQPDYLIAAEQSDGSVRLLLAECKGTSGGRSKAIGQLGSAMGQLQTIVFAPSSVGPVSIDRHAYAARVTKRGGAITLYGVDPEDEGEHWFTPSTPRRGRDDAPAFERNGQELRLPAPEEVAGRVIIRLEDRLAAWAGAGDSVEQGDLTDMRRVESDFGDLVGTTSTLELPDGTRVEVFTGTLVSVLQAARQAESDGLRKQRAEIRRAMTEDQIDDRRARAARLSRDENPERTASALTEEGLALRIEVK